MTKITQRFSNAWQITRKTLKAWIKADPFREGAIISYYAIFSIPALLVILIALAGMVFGREAVTGEISAQIGNAMGKDTARQLEEIIANAGESKSTVFAAIVGIVALIIGATGVFAQLQKSLDLVWEVEVKVKKAWLKALKDRLFSFGLILSIGFLLLVSLAISAGLSALSEWIKGNMPDYMLVVFRLISFLFSVGIITVLFALMFKILPDAKIMWRQVWLGALITALLFEVGKFGLGLYFGKADPASAYGAAGSIVLIMLWVNYSSMILFLGAEFTKQFAIHYGHEIEPTRDAVRVSGDEMQRIVADKKRVTGRTEKGRSWTQPKGI